MSKFSISDALQEESWWICAKLLTKRSFQRQPGKGPILQLLFLDRLNDIIELRSFSENKAEYLYNRVNTGYVYMISGLGFIQQPEPFWSPADYEYTDGKGFWRVHDEKTHPVPFYIRGKIKCTGNLSHALDVAARRGNVNIVATYHNHYPISGAYKYGEENRVQAYSVQVCDKYGEEFSVTVWHTTRVDSYQDFDLFQSQHGDRMLFFAARVDENAYECGETKFQTNYNPALNPNYI